MSSHFKRADRIAEEIKRKLAGLIPKEVKDPRLTGLITISAVKLSADLSYAKVYFTVFNDDKENARVILNAAAGFLRSILARSMSLRTVPELHFIYDESIEYGERLSRLIDKANDTTPGKE